MLFLQTFGFLLGSVVVPILLIALLGVWLQRKVPLDLPTLNKVQVNLLAPSFMLVKLSESELSWADMGMIALALLGSQAALGFPIWAYLKARKTPVPTAAVILLASTIFNSGNYGIPLADRAFPGKGAAPQALIVVISNTTIWLLGYLLMGSQERGKKDAFYAFLRSPLFLASAFALLLKAFDLRLWEPVRFAAETVGKGLVPMALISLGAQLGQRFAWPEWRRISPMLFLKLIAHPLVMAGVVFALGLWPWPGALLIVAASAPTAVYSFLLAVELDGDVPLAADLVFWSTLLSALTVTVVLTLVTMGS